MECYYRVSGTVYNASQNLISIKSVTYEQAEWSIITLRVPVQAMHYII